MKPDSPTVENVNNEDEGSMGMSGLGGALSGLVNLGGLSLNPSVIVNNEDGSVEPEYDMDDEVMNFMHSHIHRQLLKFTQRGHAEAENRTEQGLMDRDTKAYFEEVIRGSALFGLLPSHDNDGFDDEEEEVYDYSLAEDNDPDYQSEPVHEDTARNQLSRILLAKKVAEAFMANKPDKHFEDGGVDNSGSNNVVNQSESMNSLSWDAPLRTAKESALAPDDYNENGSQRITPNGGFIIEADLQTEREDLLEEDSPTELAKRLESELTGSLLELWQQRLTQSTSFEGEIDIEYAESDISSSGPPSPAGDGPSVISQSGATDRNGNRSSNSVKLPLPTTSDGSNATLEEIRARLRKTKFDYSTDTKVRITEATPHLDYRSVLKKKGNA